MNNIAPKLQKRWTDKIAFKIISKMLKQSNFFQSSPSLLPKDAPTKFYLSTTFGLSLMISSVAPNRLSIFYAYLITKIGNRDLKCLTCSATLMNVFKIKWQFDPFECIKMVIDKYNPCIHILFCSSRKRTVRVSFISKI